MWTLLPCSHHVGSSPRVITLVLIQSKAPAYVNTMPLTEDDIEDQLSSAQAQVASTPNHVSTSEASTRRHY